MAQLPDKSILDRAIAIRDHLEPLILAASSAAQMNGAPVLFFMVDGFSIFYRRRLKEVRLEIFQGRRVMGMRWSEIGVTVTRFQPGAWECAIARLQEV